MKDHTLKFPSELVDKVSLSCAVLPLEGGGYSLTIPSLEGISWISWNQGGRYAPQGQRCAAIKVGTSVLFLDLDRGLEYFYHDCLLDGKVIGQRYLHDSDSYHLFDSASPVQHWEVDTFLRAKAEQVPAIKR